jgi:hypothetical protein
MLGLCVDPEELQLKDEINTKWVQLWKEHQQNVDSCFLTLFPFVFTVFENPALTF